MKTQLICKLRGKKIAEWENELNEILPCDSDILDCFLITVPDESVYFNIDPGDIIVFEYVDASNNSSEKHCSLVTFKDYYDRDHRIIKVKSFFHTT